MTVRKTSKGAAVNSATMEPNLLEVLAENELLRQRLIKHEERGSFGLIWEDIPEDVEKLLVAEVPVLRPVPSLDVAGSLPSPSPHVLIEGDNLHALHVLQATHRGMVDVIYIDPPYNTGSNGFRYNDRIIDKESEYRHSAWLSFMDKRLRLARELLKETGTIFISINEEELSHLKMLCDQIFQPSNYLAMFTIKVRHEERILKGDKDFHEVVEYLLMYRSSPSYKTVKKIYDNTSNDEYVYKVEELKASSETLQFGKKSVEVFAPGDFKITKHESSGDLLKKQSIRGTLRAGNSSGRLYVQYIEPLGLKGYLFKVPDMGSDGRGFRYFLSPEKNKNGDYFQGVPTGRTETKEVPYPNYFDWEEDFNNVGKEGGVDFGGGKKPIEFLKFFIKIGSMSPSALVLDFFAGSGSTLHAVADLNNVDDGNRRCILVTNNENDICREVTQPRIKAVLTGDWATGKNEPLPGSLAYYTTAFIKRQNNLDRMRSDIAKHTIDLVAIKEGVVRKDQNDDEVTMLYGAGKSVAVVTTLSPNHVVLAAQASSAAQVGDQRIAYVFTWSDQGIESETIENWTGWRVEPLPAEMLAALRRLAPIQISFEGLEATEGAS